MRLLQISNRDYHAEREWLGSSAFKMLLNNPWEFHLWQSNLLPEREPSDSMKLGTIVDDLFSGEKTFHVWEGDRRTKTGKAEWADAVSSGFLMVTKDQYEKAQLMVEAVEASPVGYKLMRAEPGTSQTSCFATVQYQGQDVQVKCKWDRQLSDGQAVELKTRKAWETPYWSYIDRDTTVYAPHRDWRKQVNRWSYQLQAYLYCYLSDLSKGRTPILGQIPESEHYFVTVTNEHPHICMVYRSGERLLKQGAGLLERALAEYSSRREFDNWRPEGWGETIEL